MIALLLAVFPLVFAAGSAAAPKKAERKCGLICRIKEKQKEKENSAPKPKPPEPRKNEEKKTPELKKPEGKKPKPENRKGPSERKTPAEHPAGKGVYHTVKKGETLWRICHTYGVPLAEVSKANGIEDPTAIAVGQRLWMPGAERVLEVPPPPSITGPGGEKREGEAPDKSHAPTRGRLLFPVPGGKISSEFGQRGGRMHEGLDISAALGTPILAAEDGKVVYSDDGMRGYGNMVIVKHAGNIYTVYAHNRRNLVKAGDLVKRGQKIAEVGQTGRATGPHCHFEVRVGEKPVDPQLYLP